MSCDIFFWWNTIQQSKGTWIDFKHVKWKKPQKRVHYCIISFIWNPRRVTANLWWEKKFNTVCHWSWGWLERGVKELSGVTVTFCIFMYVGATQVSVSLRIYQMVHLWFVHFVVSFASKENGGLKQWSTRVKFFQLFSVFENFHEMLKSLRKWNQSIFFFSRMR